MNKQLLMGAIVFAGSLGVAASPAWSGGGYHRNSAMSEDSIVSPRVQSEAPRDFSSENNFGGGMTEGMDSYSKDALAESQTASGLWEQQTQEELSIARGPESQDQGWAEWEAKDDRDFHS